MCKPTKVPVPKPKEGVKTRQLVYAITSFVIGVWAFIKVNSISGPAFEPIIAACTNPDIAIEDFAEKTGYHVYEPKVGLVAFNVLVCLITQFLLELRQTYPAGLLTWGGVIVVSLPISMAVTLAAGRKGSKGPVRYPTIFGLLFQLLGVSVIFPMLYNPSYIFSGAKFGVPATTYRIVGGCMQCLPAIVLTYLVFSTPTDSYLWTVSAGMLGGPILAMSGLIFWTDKSASVESNSQTIKSSISLIEKCYLLLAAVGVSFWACLVAVAYDTYGFSFGQLWKDIWVEAGPSVAFMTIDTGVLYLGVLLNIAYHDNWKALKSLVLTPVIGPGAACCLAYKQMEREAADALLASGKKVD